jgi:hypothetical protein
MQIDFKALERALAPIEKIGQGELSFDAGGTPVTLRILVPAEELEVQRYAGVVFQSDEGKEDANSAVEYLDRFRTATLSYALIRVGDYDFGDVEYIETGEQLENGTLVRITKHKALRQLIVRWPRAIMVRAFHKYAELLNTVETRAEKAINFVPSDHDAEIERLEARLTDLRATKAKEESDSQEAFSARVKAVAAAPDSAQEQVVEPPADPDEPEVDPDQAMSPVHRQAPISPAAAPPPPAERAASPQPQSEPTPRRRAPQTASSFIDDSDDDAMNAALDAEHRRIAERRQRAAVGQPPVDEGSGLQAIHPQTRQPPHMAARAAEEEVGVLNAARQQATEVGEIDGAPVFRMPGQELATPSQRGPANRVGLNPVSEQGGSNNPRFVRPNKP